IAVSLQWLCRHGRHSASNIPLVAIAHTKNFTPASERALSGYLEWARSEGIAFSTFGNWLAGLAHE
ncbi:hypothetical protein D6833_03270, partial [Candidatus Parcubacteria bacterium]